MYIYSSFIQNKTMADEKRQRRSLILKLVANEPIANQGHLLERLGKLGVETTQATISRDIRDLGLVKIADSSGVYRYVTRRDHGWSTPVAEGSVCAVENSANLVVIRTRSGFAQSVAAAVDSLDWPEIMGTVGGDDTVLVVLRDSDLASGVLSRFRSLFSLES